MSQQSIQSTHTDDEVVAPSAKKISFNKTANAKSKAKAKSKAEPAPAPPPVADDSDSDEEEDQAEYIKRLMAEDKAKKKVLKKAKKDAEDKKALRDAWLCERGYDTMEAEVLKLQEQMKELKAECPHKVGFRIKGVKYAEGTEERTKLDKRYAANNHADKASKNLFCRGGDGKNGTPEHKAGGVKITGCSYCCRSQATMDKHEAQCKKYNP